MDISSASFYFIIVVSTLLAQRSNHNTQIMVTYKILLDTRRTKSDGTYAVVIRITCNRKNTTLNTGVFIVEYLWADDKSVVNSRHPNSSLLNKKITEQYLKVQKTVIELESEEIFSFEALKERISENYKAPALVRSVTFKIFAEELIVDLMAINKTGNAIVYSTAINRFTAFVSNPNTIHRYRL